MARWERKKTVSHTGSSNIQIKGLFLRVSISHSYVHVPHNFHSELTTPGQNRETWLLPQRTWDRSEGMAGRLPTSLIHRHVYVKMCWFFPYHFVLNLHLKCAFVNILLIFFIFNFTFMFCICIIAIDLIFVDFRFYSFRLEICRLYMYMNWHHFLPLFKYKRLHGRHVENLTSWLFTFEKATNTGNSRFVEIIKI